MKALLQVFGAAMTAILPLLTGAELSTTEWINVGVVAAGAITVYIAGNQTGTVWEYTKMFMSLVSAGGVVLISALTDDRLISNAEWFQVAVALITVAGVWKVPGPKAAETIGRHRRPGPKPA